VKLINIGNRGNRAFKTEDGRFHAERIVRQGVRSSYTVTDTQTAKTARADTALDIREVIRDILIKEQSGLDQPQLQPGDPLHFVREADPPDEPLHTWNVEVRKVQQVRVDGFVLTGIDGRLSWGALDTRYHRTHEGALKAFVAAKREEIASAKRKILEAERALVWADRAKP
jgi:hypothetical protein